MDNFQCNKCFKTFTVSSYSITYRAGETVYLNKNGSTIKCSHCSCVDIMYLEKEGEYNVNFTRFNTLSDADKKAVLKKRSHNHFDKKLKERKQYLDREFTGRSQDVDFKSNA